MISRRQTPWIHRFSRPIIGAIAAVGIADTGYLTSVKLSGNGIACASESCNQVLSSPYANVFGLPLTLFGLLAYLVIAVLAIGPLLLRAQSSKKLQGQLQNWSWWGLFLVGTSMAVFSGYLMYLLAFTIKAACPFCIVSAICAGSIWLLTMLGKEWEDVGQLLFRGLAVALLTVLVTLGIYAGVGKPEVTEVPTTNTITTLDPPNVDYTQTGWTITSKSGPAELELAKHLQQTGAKMYGAFYCSHCHQQKQLLGREAFKSSINYIECHPQGKNPQTELCNKEGVTAFPTWDIKGKKYPGVQLPEKLAELTDYQGAKDFQYSKLMPGFGKK